MTKARPQFDLQNGLCAIRNVAINYLQTIFQTKWNKKMETITYINANTFHKQKNIEFSE